MRHRSHAVCALLSASVVHCHAYLLDDLPPQSASATAASIAGYHPSDLHEAYALPWIGGSVGETVAIVDAYDDPKAEGDLGVYRSAFGLSPCTSANGCFKKINQRGVAGQYPPPDAHWAQEISLDLDIVSAICPNCRILLVEASSGNLGDIVNAVDTAAAQAPSAISNSYGVPESEGELSLASHYNHPGIAITASSGDGGFGVQIPAAFASVTAVGGTSLSRAWQSSAASNARRRWSESAWIGTGAGCSAYVPKPAWQSDPGCPMRTVNDVSAVADPITGVAVYDSYGSPPQTGWLVFGGTSVGSPLIASVYALAGNPARRAYPWFPYKHTFSLFDIVTGNDGNCSVSYLCNAGVGYDGPTGLGVPNGAEAF